MHKKISIIVGLGSILMGFIPLNINSKKDITYTIYTSSIVKANRIKGELIAFYKQYCYSPLLVEIDNKIKNNINKMDYNASYTDHQIIINDDSRKIKMTGYLYELSPSSINFKYYFTSAPFSIPEATSINVATLSVLDQIS